MLDVSGFLGLRRDQAFAQEEKQRVLNEMAQTRLLLEQAYAGFNNAGDFDLIDSYVYEINALQSRHSYLIKQLRELEHSVK
ncbi:MAG: hypothetical protein H6Q60_1032 [Oscillospiraceae bacterium]|nr:hypothetical protein [Oscillospiraceae bacterium]